MQSLDDTATPAAILAESAALMAAWGRAALPFYGARGSMDADLVEFPDAEGPSYYNQFAHWPLLLLSEGVLPGLDDPAERERFRAAALRNIEYMLSITAADFMTPHYSRGRDWGRHFGEWSNYFLLRSLRLMQAAGLGSAALRQRLEASIRGATQGLYDAFVRAYGEPSRRLTAFPGNHATWHALLFFEAGRHFGVEAWTAFAQDFFRRHVLPFQDETGTWPEGGGIVVNYGMVTAQAVSLYAEASGDAAALAAVSRFLAFQRFFAFPDGSSAVVADCRMRYSPRPMIFLPPSYLRTPDGRRECLQRIAGFATQFRASSEPPVVQGLAFFALFPEFVVSRGGGLPGGLPEGAVGGLPSARLDSADWTAFVSWQLTAEHASRFILDAQNFVEIWHRQAGYLVGGGNSKAMPRFSTLRRCTAGRAYIPDSARVVRQDRTQAVAAYAFGDDTLQIRLALTEGGIEVGFQRLPGGRAEDVYEGVLTLRVAAGEVLRFDADEVTVHHAAQIERRMGANGGRIQWRGRTITLPPGAALSYPVVPHNPYRQDGLPATSEYVARLALTLGSAEQVIRFA